MSLRYLILLPALGPLAYYCLALFSGWDFLRALRRRPAFDPGFAPPVSVLKPVRGQDRGGYENFASMCDLDYPEYEIVFAVADPNDPVVPQIEKLMQEFPNTRIRLITGVEQLGISLKTNSLCRLVKEAKYDLLVMNDSDVRVEKDYLRSLVAPFADPRVGVVTAFFRGLTPGGFAADVDAVGAPTFAFASTLIARKLVGIDFALGWTMATTKERLAEIGGFEPMVDKHADDFLLGNEVVKRGYRVELASKPVWMVFPDETFGEFLKHELRWSVTLRNVRPAGYWSLFLTFGFAWAVLVAAIVPSWKVALGYAALYLALRLAVAWLVGVRIVGDPVVREKLWLVPVRDALDLCVYVASFFTNTVQWRGRRYRVKGALLIPLEDVGSKA